jgi:hypothetical protein
LYGISIIILSLKDKSDCPGDRFSMVESKRRPLNRCLQAAKAPQKNERIPAGSSLKETA